MKFLQKYILLFFFINCMPIIHAMKNVPTSTLPTDPNLTARSAILTILRRQNTSLKILDFIGGNPDGSPVTQGSMTGIKSNGIPITEDIKVAENYDGTPVYKKVLKRITPICILEQEIIIDLIQEDEEKESTSTISPMCIINQEATCFIIDNKEHCNTDYDRIKHACEILNFYPSLFLQIPKDLCAKILQRTNKITTSIFSARAQGYLKDLSYNQSLLRKAVNLRNYKLMELLLKYGANPNESLCITSDDTRTILFHAAENFDPQIIKLLIKYGADCTIKDRHGYTALDY